MFHNKKNLTNKNKNNKWLFWLFTLLLVGLLVACGGSQAQEVAMSDQAPPRRGSVSTLVKVQEITAEVLGIAEADVVEEADFREDLNATDEQMTQLGEEFAAEFAIELSEAEIDGLTTVDSAVKLIDSK
jgi:acyl carrier protein